MLRNGMPVGEVTVDDLVQYAMVGVEQAANGDVSGGELAFSRDSQINSPAFKRWFGDSKVVDAEGKPLVVYHGTRTKGEAIDSFDIEKAGSKTDSGWMGTGFYFGDQQTADAYAGHYEFNPDHYPEGGAVYPVYLSIQNPAILKDSERNDGPRTMVRELLGLADEASASEVRDSLLAAGYDGVIYERFSPYGNGYREYVAFRPEQIKSAVGNNGDFDPSNPDIRFSRSGAAGSAGRAALDLGRSVGDAIKSMTVQDVKRSALGKWTDFLSLGLQSLGRRQLVDLYDGMLPMRKYAKLVERMDADKNDTGAAADELARRWGKLKDSGKLAD